MPLLLTAASGFRGSIVQVSAINDFAMAEWPGAGLASRCSQYLTK